MKIIKQIFLILLFYVLGEVFAKLIEFVFPKIYIPGTIIGMLLLVILLVSGKIKLNHVNEVGTFLSSNMAFFFIPAAVSVIEYFDLLKESIVKILIIITISTFLSFIAITLSVKITYKVINKNKEEKTNA